MWTAKKGGLNLKVASWLCVAIGIYLFWGFNMAVALTGWTALRFAIAVFMLYSGYRIWVHNREVHEGLHQWPTPKGHLYDAWMKIPVDDRHADYYAWLAELKDWREPWATWAKLEAERNSP